MVERVNFEMKVKFLVNFKEFEKLGKKLFFSNNDIPKSIVNL